MPIFHAKNNYSCQIVQIAKIGRQFEVKTRSDKFEIQWRKKQQTKHQAK